MPSCPMPATNRPRKPASQPFSGSAATTLPEITTPSSASQKNSNAPKLSATSPSSGVNSARQTRPNSVPTTEPVVAMPIARPACPCRASA